MTQVIRVRAVCPGMQRAARTEPPPPREQTAEELRHVAWQARQRAFRDLQLAHELELAASQMENPS